MNEATPDRYVRRFRELRLPAPRLRGTFAPFFLASDRPIAIACFRLFTVPPFPPRPDFSVPFFRRRIALAVLGLAIFLVAFTPTPFHDNSLMHFFQLDPFRSNQ